MAASDKKRKRSTSNRRDRLSSLSDDVLGHVLSFLPTMEAGRAAALARRWRHVFGSVHTISFEEAEGARANDWTTWYYETLEYKSFSALPDDVGAALLCRRRCAGIPVPLRSLRFAFDSWHCWDGVAVDQWLSYVLLPHGGRVGGEQPPELHLDMRFHQGPACASEQDPGAKHSMDPGYSSESRYLLPRRLFSFTGLRTLCVTYCRLKLERTGMAIDLPLLETMRLTALNDSGGSIQQLISSCPRLADLTLEALWKLKTISVLDKRLRRFSLRCCHVLESAEVDASELRSLDYKGVVPVGSLLSLHGSPAAIPSCTIDFCMPLHHLTDFVRFRDFLGRIPPVTHLHLHLQSLESKLFARMRFPPFSSCLTRLTLRGFVQGQHSLDAVRRTLGLTQNLEVLTLQLLKKKSEKVDEIAEVSDDEASFSIIPCLQHRLREIAIVNYGGLVPEKMLAKLLLRNALVLERLRVVFSDELYCKWKKIRLEAQMGKWGVANSENIFTSMKRSSLP